MTRFLPLLLLNIAVLTLSACGGGGGSSTPPLPTAQSASIQLNEDSSANGTLSGAAKSGGSLSFQLINEPAHGEITLSGNSYTYTPTPDYNGPDQFTFKTMEDGRSSAAATVSISVDPVNDGPTLDAQSLQVNEDNNLVFSADGQDVDGDTLSAIIVELPVHGAITITEGQTLSYTPFENYFGTDQLTIKVSDGALESAPVVIDINVVSVNDAPTATYTNFDVYSGKQFTVTTEVFDVENDNVTISVQSKPEQITLVSGLGSEHSGVFSVQYGTPIDGSLTLVFDDGQDQFTLEIPLALKVEDTTFSEKHAVIASEYAGGLVLAEQSAFVLTQSVVGNSNIIQYGETADQLAELGRVGLGKRVLFDAGFADGEDVFFAARSDSFDANGSLNFYKLTSTASLTQQSVTVAFEGSRFKSIEVSPINNGYLVIGSDNKAHIYDGAGNLQSTNTLPTLPIDGLINEIFDLEETADGFRFVAGIWGCGDNTCNSRTGYGTAIVVYSDETSSYQMSEILPTHFQSAVIFEDNLFVAKSNGVKKYDVNGTTLDLAWETDASVVYGESSIEVTDKGVFIGTVYDDSGIQFSRLDGDGNVTWSHIQALDEEGSFRGWDVSTLADQHGNGYLRFTLRSDTHSPLGYLAHWDFLGRRQWLTAITYNDTDVLDISKTNSTLFRSETEIFTLNQTTWEGNTTTRLIKTTVDRNLD